MDAFEQGGHEFDGCYFATVVHQIVETRVEAVVRNDLGRRPRKHTVPALHAAADVGVEIQIFEQIEKQHTLVPPVGLARAAHIDQVGLVLGPVGFGNLHRVVGGVVEPETVEHHVGHAHLGELVAPHRVGADDVVRKKQDVQVVDAGGRVQRVVAQHEYDFGFFPELLQQIGLHQLVVVDKNQIGLHVPEAAQVLRVGPPDVRFLPQAAYPHGQGGVVVVAGVGAGGKEGLVVHGLQFRTIGLQSGDDGLDERVLKRSEEEAFHSCWILAVGLVSRVPRDARHHKLPSQRRRDAEKNALRLRVSAVNWSNVGCENRLSLF